MVLSVQLFNKIKLKKKKTKNMSFAVFPRCYVEIHFFGELILLDFFSFFFSKSAINISYSQTL